MVAIKGNEVVSVPLDEVGGRLRLVEPGNRLVRKAKNMGVCFGE
mgnify:FL=1